MPINKLRLALPLAGTAAMAAMYVSVYHLSETTETAPDLQTSVTASSGESNAGLEHKKPEPTPVAAESTGGTQSDPLQNQLSPETVRRNSSRWSRSLAAFGDDFVPSGDDNHSGLSAAAAGNSNAPEESPAGSRGSAARRTASLGGGGGGGGRMLSPLGTDTNNGGAPENFFLVSNENQPLPQLVDVSSGPFDEGNDPSSGAAGSGLGDGVTLIAVNDGPGDQVIPPDVISPKDDLFGSLTEQSLEQSGAGAGLTNTDEEPNDDPNEPKQKPAPDQRTQNRVPDNTGTLGLVALSMLGLAGLRRWLVK
jgi:hypothetical protein